MRQRPRVGGSRLKKKIGVNCSKTGQIDVFLGQCLQAAGRVFNRTMGAIAKIQFHGTRQKKISLKVKVDKIDKAHLYKGEKATYLTRTIVPAPSNQYGDDYMVTQYRADATRESVILGNGRDLQLSWQRRRLKFGTAMPSAMAADAHHAEAVRTSASRPRQR